MAYRVELAPAAQKALDKLDRPAAARILDFLASRVAALDNPRSIGEALKGDRLGELWKYRVSDWRIIASIEDARLVVLVVKIGHHREVYR